MIPRHRPPTQFYDLTQQEPANLNLAIDERLSYLVDMIETALGLEYLKGRTI